MRKNILVQQQVRVCDTCGVQTERSPCLRCGADFCYKHGDIVHGGNADPTELAYCNTCYGEFMSFMFERYGPEAVAAFDFEDWKAAAAKWEHHVEEL